MKKVARRAKADGLGDAFHRRVRFAQQLLGAFDANELEFLEHRATVIFAELHFELSA